MGDEDISSKLRAAAQTRFPCVEGNEGGQHTWAPTSRCEKAEDWPPMLMSAFGAGSV